MKEQPAFESMTTLLLITTESALRKGKSKKNTHSNVSCGAFGFSIQSYNSLFRDSARLLRIHPLFFFAFLKSWKCDEWVSRPNCRTSRIITSSHWKVRKGTKKTRKGKKSLRSGAFARCANSRLEVDVVLARRTEVRALDATTSSLRRIAATHMISAAHFAFRSTFFLFLFHFFSVCQLFFSFNFSLFPLFFSVYFPSFSAQLFSRFSWTTRTRRVMPSVAPSYGIFPFGVRINLLLLSERCATIVDGWLSVVVW